MAKQVKVEAKKTTKKQIVEDERQIRSRSPKTNLIFALVLGLIYFAIFGQNIAGSIIYAGVAFMFFNTVDYCVLYYRMNKKERN